MLTFEQSLASQLPFWHFYKDFMIYTDGSLGLGHSLTGLDISCREEEEVNDLSRKIENLFLSSLEGMRFQIYYKLEGDTSALLEKHQKMAQGAPQPYQIIASARANFFKSAKARGSHYFMPQIYLFVRSKPLKYRKKRIFEKKSFFQKETQREFFKHKKEFEKELRRVESELFNIGLKPRSMSSKMWFNLLFDALNFSRADSVGRAQLRQSKGPFTASLAEQLTLSDLCVHKDCLKIGNHFFRIISLKTLPDGFTYSAMVKSLCHLSFHLWIVQSSQILNQERERESLQLKRRLANAMALGSGHISDIESESKLGQLESLIRELVEGVEKLALMDLSVIVWSKSYEGLDEKSNEVLKALREMNQAEGVVETFASFRAFMNALPGVCTGLRKQKVKTSNLAHLAPLYGEWMGGDDPVCLISTRAKGLFSFCPFEKSFPNYNALIFGSSGAGKSFNLCQLMLMFYGKNPTPKLYWIDNGASSQKLVDVLEGEFIDFHLESGLCLNPLSVSGEKIKLALAALELIFKDEQAKGLPKRNKALLEECLVQIYEQFKHPTLSHLKSLLDEHFDGEMRKYGQILYSWTGSRPFGRVLDGPTNIKLKKDVVAIEVQSLNDHPELKSVVLLLLTSYMKEEAMKDLKRPSLLIVDEAERLFKTEMAKQFIITCYRTLRKYNSGIYCVSQNYRDFMSDEELRNALLPNSANIFILRQKKIDWADFQKTFDFRKNQLVVIKSLEIKKGHFSEMVLFQEEKMSILKLEPEPLSYWISTSDGRDRVSIEELKKEFKNAKTIEILKKLASKKEH